MFDLGVFPVELLDQDLRCRAVKQLRPRARPAVDRRLPMYDVHFIHSLV